jgi:cytochrome c2
MKKALRYLLVTIGIILLLVAIFAAFVAIRGIPHYKAEKINLQASPTPQRIAQGEKLASMLCRSCHFSENTGKFTGRRLDEIHQFGDIYSKNITKDPNYGIGKWTDGELAYLLRTGIKPDGTYLPPYMPKLSSLSEEDLYSLIAFLRSDHPWVQPDDVKQPASSPSFLTKFLTNIGAMKPFPYPKAPIPGPDTANKAAWGKYIALSQLDCFSCHSKDFAKNDYYHPENSPGFFGGGNEMYGMDGRKIRSLNITMDEETGIGQWTEQEFVTALRSGILPGSQPALRLPMIPYANLTDAEASAVYTYLKTIPKIHNKVERAPME